MKTGFSGFNERIFSAKEISSVGAVGTMRILRGGAARILNFIGRCLCYTTARAYGCFLMSFGGLSLLLHLAEYYFKSSPEVPLHTLLLCAVIVVASIPFLLFSKPVCIAFQDFTITDRIFFEFMSIKRMHRNIEHKSIPPLLAVFLGFVPAILSYFLTVESVIVGIIVAALTVIAFTSPEFSMILTVILLPYLPLFPTPTLLLCSLSVITFLSYAIKVVIGKRSFSLDVYSIVAMLIMLVVLIGGISGYGGKTVIDSLEIIALIIGYFPISNIVINRRLADSVLSSVILSAVPITVISVIEFIVELPATPFAPPSYSTPGTSAFFSSPSALAAFLLVSAILTLVYVFERKIKVLTFLYFLFFVLELAVLCIVIRPGIWVAALFAIVAYLVIGTRKIPIDTLSLLIVISHLVFLVPADVMDTVYDYVGASPSHSEILARYENGFAIFGDNVWFGINMGDTGAATSYGNAMLGLGLELGVIALALFVLVLIIRMRHLSYYRLYVRKSDVDTVGDMTAVSMVALLVYGAFENVFADLTVTYVFLTVFALSTAVLRTAKRENDDLLGYYGDSRSSDSSALDVSLSR